MVRRVDLSRFLNRAMVQPQNDIAVISIIGEVRTSHGHRLIGIVSENSERARRVEADTPDGGGVDVVLRQRALHAGTDAAPDICCGLLVVACLGLPEADVLGGHCELLGLYARERSAKGLTGFDVAGLIDNAGSCAAGTDVDTDVVVHMNMEIIVRAVEA